MKNIIATSLIATVLAIGFSAPSFSAPLKCQNIASCFNPSVDH